MLKSRTLFRVGREWRNQLMKPSTSSMSYHQIALGIETSCDDTAVAIVRSDGRILASRRYADREALIAKGGVEPAYVALQHNKCLPLLFEGVLRDSGLSPSEFDLIAVTARPGLVIALLEGLRFAIKLANDYKKDLVEVHHMRAHALSALLVCPDVQFPFLSILISGGHSLFALANGPNDFKILGTTTGGSPGELLDKIGRELKVNEIPEFRNLPCGAAIEILASRSTNPEKYVQKFPHTPRADMNFHDFKGNLLYVVKEEQLNSHFSLPDFCAGLLWMITGHIANKLNVCLEFLTSGEHPQFQRPTCVALAGGVASNSFIFNGISKLCASFSLRTIRVPPRLCTDNAEMIAWAGLLAVKEGCAVHKYPNIPETIFAIDKFPIGEDVRHLLPEKPKVKLSTKSLFCSRMPHFVDKNEYRRKVKEKAADIKID